MLMGLNEATSRATNVMKNKWRDFAKEMQQQASGGESAQQGELIVLGSGIAHADLAISDEPTIKSADHVFHCLYDRVTQVWINSLRPDALDLRVLYDPRYTRHDTYVCMAEAMLHYVRRGRKVVAIFYGHPGIFATATHRAVKIARREGHLATMRPGISALDYLIADVGFDPMIPGLLSYEASDLLLRQRRLDSSLHTVIWQVGTVGEFGFAPMGFENRAFPMFLEYLAQTYGWNTQVTNYIAPQYAGLTPLVARYSLRDLREEEVRKEVTALSTFYIAPITHVSTDRPSAAALGFPLAEGEELNHEYDIAGYSAGERNSLRRFCDFDPPRHYATPAASPATNILLALSRDPEFLAVYRRNPAEALADARFNDLSDRARQLMMIDHPHAFNAAIAEPPLQLGSVPADV